ncbi:MAG TPA: hypothetical protein ACFYEM_00325 [Candidatus Hypogeohydataceae bacterium YC40]
MFIRMVKTKTGSQKKTHCYLRVVESFRSNGKVKQRVLWNMGKLERVRPGLNGLLKSLIRFSGEQFLNVREIKDRRVSEYGNILLLKYLWEGSGFRKILESNLGKDADCIMAMVFYRLCQPATYACGATALLSWLKRINLPEAERLARLGQGRLRKRLLNGINTLGRLEWSERQKSVSGHTLRKLPAAKRSFIIEIGPLSYRGKRYRNNYLAILPLGSNNFTRFRVHTRKEFVAMLQKLKSTKGILIVRYSTLGRKGVAFLDKESVPYLAFFKKLQPTRRRPRRRHLTIGYGNQKVQLRTNIAKSTSLYQAKRAFKGLLEAESALGRPALPPFMPPGKAYLKGYILVLMLAYLIEKLLQKGLAKHGIRFQPKEALDTLKEVRIVSNLLAGRRWDYLTGMTRERCTLLKIFGIKRPSLNLKAQMTNATFGV